MISTITNRLLSVFCLSCLILYSDSSNAQFAAPSQSSITLITNDAGQSTIKFESGGIIESMVNTPLGEAVIISIDEGTPILQKGFPDLPKLTASIIIPDDKNMAVTVTSASYSDYENILVAPSKGSLLRDVDPAAIPFYFDSAYQENKFFPKDIAALREPYILRDYRAQTVIVFPIQYNPVTKTLRVYSEITVSVSANNNAADNVLKRNPNAEIKTPSVFNELYKNRFINFESDTRYEQLEEEGNLLIISYGPYINAMQPLADWKIQKGMRTEIVDVSVIGNDKTSIKNYVANYYNTKGLTYLLLAGDAAQVASGSTGAGDADNDYGYILGDDHYQEIFVGRFSAETEADIISQVSKTIAYEKTPSNDNYFSKGICIASNEGAGIGDEGQSDFEHQDLIREQLLNYNYTDVAELFDGTQGNVDAPGNPVANDLSSLINSGTGLITYTGHGSGSSLSTTDFSITDANNLVNTGKWPFIWVVGCSVGNFTGTTCLAEALARSSHNGEPAGAVASFMSTILQAWAEPMEAQDEINLILTESYPENIKRTFGGLSINGCFSMNDAYGNTGYNMTDTWTIFGDPSLEIRTAQPTVISATHAPTIELGSTHFTVTCDAENALVCMAANGIIISIATVTGGLAELSFPPLTILDTLSLTITGYNKTPYINHLPALQPAGAFLYNTNLTINDSAGNGNGLADFDEDVMLDITLQNAGLSTASGITATLSTTDTYITITDATATYPAIASDAAGTLQNAFALTVADNVPDGHTALFNCTVTDNAANTWNMPVSILLNAPSLTFNVFTINDAAGGNGDGYLDPSETATITLSVVNQGHSTISEAIATLSSSSNFISIDDPVFTIGNMAINENLLATFQVYVAPNATYGIDIPFSGSLDAGAYSNLFDFETVISPAIENFESNNLTTYNWQLSGIANWFTTTESAFEGSYCSRSGDIGNNDSSTLEIVLDVQFADDLSFAYKVSSEGNYDFLQFYIDGELKNQWSGESGWAEAFYQVDSGMHSFKWVYMKDGYFSEGSDAAWLDHIFLPAFEVNTATFVNAITPASSFAVYPNPFERLTMISYMVPSSADVTLDLYNAYGQLIRKLYHNNKQSAGNYQFAFDGEKLSSGIYLCAITIDGVTHVQKLICGK